MYIASSWYMPKMTMLKVTLSFSKPKIYMESLNITSIFLILLGWLCHLWTTDLEVCKLDTIIELK